VIFINARKSQPSWGAILTVYKNRNVPPSRPLFCHALKAPLQTGRPFSYEAKWTAKRRPSLLNESCALCRSNMPDAEGDVQGA
jgi:hypothetical protein